jgi:hypothetical protein
MRKNNKLFVKLQVTAGLYRPVIPALRRLRQEDLELDACLGYIARPYQKPKQNNNNKNKNNNSRKPSGQGESHK